MFELVPYTRKRNVTFYNPFDELEDMQRRFFGETAVREFKTDIRDEGEHYLLEADLPGFKKEDISVNIEGDTLTIRAERTESTDEKDSKGNYIKRERSYGSFSRSFDMTGIRVEDIAAAYENGVLKLTLPKRQETLPTSRKLEIA
ncbi:Acid shock protein [bioreactor metagenome]|uniref:Acid shock protein n=1 Tax=bioreactor metagenome TaxID=1076179 RepID=A0A645DLN2_9ZZZZ